MYIKTSTKTSLFIKISAYILWVPVILSISFEIFTFSDWLYTYNWSRNNISNNTGLSIAELNHSSNSIKTYFKNDLEKIDTTITKNNNNYQIFNEKEIDHMVDVKILIQKTLLFEKLGILLLTICLIILIYIKKLKKIEEIIRNIIIKSFLLWGLFLSIIIVSMIVNFNYTFILFHKLLFRNDLWILNPRTDFLLMMFPQRFFLEIAIGILILFFIINIFILSLIKIIKSKFQYFS
jgi:integral membrane protein (TIGR01906 family)